MATRKPAHTMGDVDDELSNVVLNNTQGGSVIIGSWKVDWVISPNGTGSATGQAPVEPGSSQPWDAPSPLPTNVTQLTVYVYSDANYQTLIGGTSLIAPAGQEIKTAHVNTPILDSDPPRDTFRVTGTFQALPSSSRTTPRKPTKSASAKPRARSTGRSSHDRA